jgi:hypothetical protein
MFNQVVSSKQWDSENEVNDDRLHSAQMKTVEFCVNELQPLHRTAIGLNARNLCTGRQVWSSARLPTDVAQRAVILADARNLLIKRLIVAGIL